MVYAGISVRVGKNKTMENIEAKQSRYLVSMPPFGHYKDGLRRLWFDLILGYIPATLVCIVADLKLVYVFVAALSGFILAGIASRQILSSDRYYKISLRKYILCSMALVILLSSHSSIKIVFLSALTAGLLDEFVLGVKGRTFMPSFLISWIFLSGIQKVTVINYTVFFPIVAGIGVLYLMIRRWISLYTFIGVAAAYLYGIIYIAELSRGQKINLMIIALLILSYPGILPKGNNAKFIFAVICGILILNFGFWGLVIAMLFTGIVDRLIKK